MRKLLQMAGMTIYYIYFISVIVFIPYFNWQYAKENGFWQWLAFGEVIATGKGIVWPYFIFFEKDNDSNLSHLIKSLDYANDANAVGNNEQPFSYLSKDEIGNIIELNKKALSKAEFVDIEKLNSRHPNFGNHFRDEYLKGLNLLIEGYENNQTDKFIQGQILLVPCLKNKTT